MNDEPITEASLLAQLEQARRERDKANKQLADYLESAHLTDAEKNEYTIRLSNLDLEATGAFLMYFEKQITDLKAQIAERAAALCQSCPLLAGSADLLGVINTLRLQRMEAEANDELHKRAAVTLGKWYLSAKTRQALDDLRTCECEEVGS